MKGVLQQIRQPESPEKATKLDLDPFKRLFKAAAEDPGTDTAPLDPLGNLIENLRKPSDASDSKYDPIQAVFNSQMPSGKLQSWLTCI